MGIWPPAVKSGSVSKKEWTLGRVASNLWDGEIFTGVTVNTNRTSISHVIE